MTEDEWLKDRPADDMLEFVADRLAPRQWRFLCCGLVRKLWDLLPPGPLRDAVEWVELHPDDTISDAARKKWAAQLGPAADAAADHAQAEMRAVVKSADPDAAPPPGTAADADELPPSKVLFDAASRHAATAVAVIAQAAGQAAGAVSQVLLAPGEDAFGLIQEQASEALNQKTAANLAAANALKLKALGDEFADSYNVRTARLDRSKAVARVNQIDEAAGAGTDQGERTVRRHVARLLHEVVGNPFTPPRFEAAWRTSDAVAVAESIYADRAFDRLPILADALLDADCDAEAVLRHCRGTERHLDAKESQPHVRGCWVVELVLGRWEPLGKPKKGAKARRPKAPSWLDLDIGLPPRGDDRLA